MTLLFHSSALCPEMIVRKERAKKATNFIFAIAATPLPQTLLQEGWTGAIINY